METFLPYIVSVLCALIAGFTSYSVARKQAKADMQKLEKQYELDIEKEREKFSMEKEKLEIEHKYQLELLHRGNENALGAGIVNTFMSEAVKLPEVRRQLSQGVRDNAKKRHK